MTADVKHAPPYPNAATDPFNKVPGMNKPSATSTPDKLKLLPCPFCGGRAKTKLPYVRCVDCGGQMCFGEGDAFDAAITAWNARANVAHAAAAKDAALDAGDDRG